MSQYSSYKNSSNKLSKIWNKIQELANGQFLKHNKEVKFVHERNKLKTSKIIIDTDWFPLQATNPAPTRTTTIKNELVPIIIDINKSLDFRIEDNLLPFLDISVFVKPQPETIAALTYTDTIHELGQTILRIKGDSTILYQGTTSAITNVKHIYTQSDIDNGIIHPTFHKKTFQTTLEYTNGSDNFRIIGKVVGFKLRKPLNTGCDNLDRRDYDCFDFNFNGSVGEEKHQKINSLTSSTIDIISTLNETLFVGSPGSCSGNTTTTDNTSAVLNWSDITQNIWFFEDAIKQKFISGNWTNQSFTGQTITLDGTSGNTTTNRTFTQLGFWLFGGPISKFRLFAILQNHLVTDIIYGPNCRGNDSTYFLPGGTLGDLTWVAMTIDINPTGFPVITKVIRTAEANENNKQVFFKITNDIDINTYRLFLKRNILMIVPASNKTIQPITSYTNTYTGGPPVVPNNVACHNKTQNTYQGNLNDIECRVMISIKNPLYWTENKRL